MQNPIVITHDGTFTIDQEILVTGVRFTRQNKSSGAMVRLLAPDHGLVLRFNDTVKVDWSQRHGDLLMRLPAGAYSVTGMIAGDSLAITWKLPTPKPEPVILDLDELERDRARHFQKRGRFLTPVPAVAPEFPNVSPHLQP